MTFRLSTTEQDIVILFSFYSGLILISGAIASLGVKLYQKVFKG